MRRLGTLVGLALAAGCANPPTTGPDILIGNYQATQFTIDITGNPRRDVLAAGGSVTLQLAAGLTTSGRLVIPLASGVTGAPYDHNLAGTYRVLGSSSIKYTSIGDSTFIDGYVFVSDPPELRAFVTLQGTSGGLISLVLRKQ